MAKCKICGGAVRCEDVVHSSCRERAAEEIMATMCDEYCRFPFEAADIDELEEKHCDSCKIAKLLGVIKSAAAPVGSAQDDTGGSEENKKRDCSGGRRKQPQNRKMYYNYYSTKNNLCQIKRRF